MTHGIGTEREKHWYGVVQVDGLIGRYSFNQLGTRASQQAPPTRRAPVPHSIRTKANEEARWQHQQQLPPARLGTKNRKIRTQHAALTWRMRWRA